MYHSDKPIEQKEEDLLGRSTFAQQLADSILSIDLQDSFAIGIYGKWGTGKTSVLNITQKEIESKAINEDGSPRVLVMRFEPWNFSSCDQLLTQFFAQMATVVSCDKTNESLLKVGSALEQYSSSLDLLGLIPGAGSILKLLPTLAHSLGSTLKEDAEKKLNDLSIKKQNVIDALKKQNCRIVVIIDDIDRLSNDQIRLIFQLVSSVAGFPNVIYVLAFDKYIVANALKTVQMDNGLDFLEKVIQVPFELPDVDKSRITGVFISRLNSLLTHYTYTNANNEHWDNVFGSCIAPYIHTVRDVNRVINALSLKLSLVREEANLADLTAITVFQTMKPWVYEWILLNRKTLTQSMDISHYALHELRPKKTKEDYIIELSSFGDSGEAASIFYALITLFPKLASDTNEYYKYESIDDLRVNRRIAHHEFFDLYTMLSLDKLPLDAATTHSALFEYSEDEFSALLLDLNEKQRVAGFLVDVNSRIPTLPQDRIQILMNSLFNTANKLKDEQNSPYLSTPEHLARIDYETLLSSFDERNRSDLLLAELVSCDKDGLLFFANVLNNLELSHGRLAAKGKQEENKLISLEGLTAIENAFMKRVYELFGNNSDNLLNDSSRMLCYLWSCLDKEGYSNKLKELFGDTENILRFVATFIHTPKVIIGPKDQSWRVSDGYKEFVKEIEVYQVLDTMLKDQSFFNLEYELQQRIAAYKVWNTSQEKDEYKRAPIELVDKKLQEWIDSFNAGIKETVKAASSEEVKK